MKNSILFILFFLSSALGARTLSSQGAEAYLSLSKELSPRLSLGFFHSDTFNFYEQHLGSKDYHHGHAQTYFQTSLTYKYLPTLNFTVGHIYQRNDPFNEDHQNEHRLYLQSSILGPLGDLNFTHRFRLEERFIEERSKEETLYKTRLRYQLGLLVPLRGLSLDAGEFYFNTYNEVYLSLLGERNALYSDNELYAGFGYQTGHWGRFELGPSVKYSVINRDKDGRSLYHAQGGWIYKF